MRSATPQRSLSFSSISSTSSCCMMDDSGKSNSKRTRKRFSQEQLIVLEHMYQKSSHPSRADREAAAKQVGMDLKSVTIWFQNKRQSERKVALHNSTNRGSANGHLLASSSLPSRASSAPLYPSSAHPARHVIASTTRALAFGTLSLDRIASRSEAHLPRSPCTPPNLTRLMPPQYPLSSYTVAPVWDSMPSSPVQVPNAALSPSSPFSRDILDFKAKMSGKSNKRSLEWACASARLAERSAGSKVSQLPIIEIEDVDVPSPPTTVHSEPLDDGEDTEVESIYSHDAHEVITPDSSQDSMVVDWTSKKNVEFNGECFGVEVDIMDAAWTLCGLSRR